MSGTRIQSKTTAALCTLAALAVVLGPAPWSAEAASCVCSICVGDGDLVIVSGNITVNCVQIERGGQLWIEAGCTLTLTGPGPSTVDGDIVLLSNASVLKFAISDHTVTGSGKIKGQDNEAKIEIALGVTFTNDAKITGALQIAGAGNFVNDGHVTADRHSGTLDILVGGTIDDTGSASWEVENSTTATLRFTAEPACLDGAFTVTWGTLRAGMDSPFDDIDVITTGHLTQTSGKIVAGANDSFTFNGTCP